ncbi:MAG: aminotransferase class V-fold PLP-dependent enzyme, partial [Phycisphaerales bacterium]|nr:aminotransferase class V-fold PLP-dependent enzyme [Phycisphaerales bacterium]
MLFDATETELIKLQAERLGQDCKPGEQGVYLDHAATSWATPEVISAVERAMRTVGNPSSAHSRGTAVSALMEEARSSVAMLAGGEPEQVVFTSGGTEGNNAVLRQVAHSRSPLRRLAILEVEHPSVTGLAQQMEDEGIDVTHIPVDGDGICCVDSLAELDIAADTLVSVQFVNSETGVVQPLEQIASVVKATGAKLHTDAVQAYGKISLEFSQLSVDFMTVSAHKIGGPCGVGAVLVKEMSEFQPLIVGGGQESRRRGGTENI